MKKLLIVSMLVLFSVAFLSADVYIKQQTKTGAFMGQPAKEFVQEQWFDYNRIATVSPENSFIVNMSEKKFVMINHGAKTYIETTLPLDMSALMPEQMAGMMKSMMDGITVSVKPNGQSQKIMTWNAQGYDVIMNVMGMEMKMVFWASTEVPFDWKKLSALSAELYKAQLRVGEKFIEEFKKIEGYPIATDMDVMGMKINMTTLEIGDKTPPAGIYTAPAGYTKKDRLDIGEMKK